MKRLDPFKKKEKEKNWAPLVAVGLILAGIGIFSVFCGTIMTLFGFQYESVGGMLLFFLAGAVISHPLNLIAGAFSKTLLNLNKLSEKKAMVLCVILDAAGTFLGFTVVDFWMSSVAVNSISLAVLSLILGLACIGDFKKK